MKFNEEHYKHILKLYILDILTKDKKSYRKLCDINIFKNDIFDKNIVDAYSSLNGKTINVSLNEMKHYHEKMVLIMNYFDSKVCKTSKNINHNIGKYKKKLESKINSLEEINQIKGISTRKRKKEKLGVMNLPVFVTPKLHLEYMVSLMKSDVLKYVDFNKTDHIVDVLINLNGKEKFLKYIKGITCCNSFDYFVSHIPS